MHCGQLKENTSHNEMDLAQRRRRHHRCFIQSFKKIKEKHVLSVCTLVTLVAATDNTLVMDGLDS